ncbi:MarR family winged helix-turn-helix transcriptional regulator [Methanobrevibacter sp. TMH8]|uniref:MarR family winged helix-turn-helix transcriptional regulator n=1 Tax=Methanobrevibacter sp. TMH8 TaxID=2848611 RepID=UPI001CCCDF74|nr:MarR family winged helix-turn-helix transcriptional regulator [Methanobrevibacter sp. TMH8]MBZ9571111.1 MarR family winged helix-turn-helix transcriptional regulator [Methanobrevibacter sp. TMH8]
MENKENIEENSSEASEDFLMCDLVTIIYKSYKNYLMYKLTDLDITPGQIPFILELMRSKNASQDDLANKLFVTRGTTAKALRKLDDQEIIERKTALNNRRKYNVFLTDKGKETALEIEKIDKSWEDMILSRLKESENFENKEQLINNLKSLAKSSLEIFDQEKEKFKDSNGPGVDFSMHPFAGNIFKGHHFRGHGHHRDLFRNKGFFPKDPRKK